MALKFKYLEAIHYGKNKLFEDLKAPIWSSVSIHQMMVTDAYVEDMFNVLISDYCNIEYVGKYVKSDFIVKKLYSMSQDGERHIINDWFKNFIILSRPKFHENGDITLVQRYSEKSQYKPFVELVKSCLMIEVIYLNRPINPKFLSKSPTGKSAINANSSTLERYQNLQKLNGD